MFNPVPGWLAASSFVEPVTPPGVEPDSSPGVSVCFSAAWLPYVLGSLQQMCQPTAWDTSDPAVLQTTLDRAQALLELFGTAGACMLLRWSDADCALEQSADGGATWTAITGWDINGLAACLQTPLIDIGGAPGTGFDGPPNPPGVSTAQKACNIASWLAIEVLQGSLSSLATSIGAADSTLNAALGLLNLVPGFIEFGGGFFDVAALVFGAATAIGQTALNSAASDATLRGDLICAIYSAIRTDGKVTPSNVAAILTNINAIAYSVPAIVGLIHNYVSGLGFTGLNAIQAEGSLYAGDCSSCPSPPSGCVPLHANVIGGGVASWTETGLTPSVLVTGASDCYQGVTSTFPVPVSAVSTLWATMPATGQVALGWRHADLTLGGPSCGNDNWVSSVDAWIIWNPATGQWHSFAGNTPHGSGTAGVAGDVLKAAVAPSSPVVDLFIFNGISDVLVDSISIGSSTTWFPVAWGFLHATTIDGVQLCTS